MTNKEAIRVLKSTSVNLGRRGGRTAYAEALEMAISALQELNNSINYTNNSINNSNDEVKNANDNSTNEIKNRVKGMTACRVSEDDTVSRKAYEQCARERDIAIEQLRELGYGFGEKIRTDGDTISRQAAIDIFDDYNVSVENGELEAYSRDRKRLCDLPSAQPETAKRIVGKSRNGMTLWYQCDMCNEPVDAQDIFCRGCGRRLTDG